MPKTVLPSGGKVQWETEGDRFIACPDAGCPNPYCTLDEILAECAPSAEVSEEDAEWTGGRPVGRELV